MDSILEDSVDSFDDNLVDTIFEMFTNEHALDYSSPPLWDDYDDELFDLETVNDDTLKMIPFYSKGIEKSKIFSDVDALTSNQQQGQNVFNPEDLILTLYELPFQQRSSPHFETATLNYLIGTLKLSKSLNFLKAGWKIFLALMERTSVFWMFRVSISIPLDQFKIAQIFEVSRALGFCPSFTRASNPQLHFRNPISESYRLTFIFKHT
ncbi:hypothetical protein Tco_0047845 [Tanacetum coccineum]